MADAWSPLLWLPDEREVEVRDDVLTFTTDALPGALDLAGQIEAHVTIGRMDAPAHLMVKLVDVSAAGRARRITEGAMRLAAQTVRADVDLGHVGYRVQEGHALRLEISSSSFPRYLPESGSSADPWYADAAPPSKRLIESGGSHSSYLTLHVLGKRAPANA